MKVFKEPTPNGGAYSHVHYYDLNGKEVSTEENAVAARACEFTSDGRILKETIFSLSSNNNEEDMNKMIDSLEETKKIPIIKHI